jgi:hypothetical protein
MVKNFSSRISGADSVMKSPKYYSFRKQQYKIEYTRNALVHSVGYYKKVHSSLVAKFNKVLDDPFLEDLDLSLIDSESVTDLSSESTELNEYFENFDYGIKKYIDVSRNFYKISECIVHDYKPAAVLYERLYELRERLKESPSPAIILEIKQLLREQAELVNLSFRKNVRHLRNYSKIILTGFRQDARKHLRSIISFIYKCYSDFSGCEEEELAAYAYVMSKFFNKHNFSGNDTLRFSENFRFSYTIG